MFLVYNMYQTYNSFLNNFSLKFIELINCMSSEGQKKEKPILKKYIIEHHSMKNGPIRILKSKEKNSGKGLSTGDQQEEIKIIEAEVSLSTFMAENNLPLSMAKNQHPNIYSQVTLYRQKVSNIINKF